MKKPSFNLALISIIGVLSLNSCVSERKYSELKNQMEDCTNKKERCETSYKDLDERMKTEKELREKLAKEVASLQLDSAECHLALDRTKKLYGDLQELQQRIITNTRDEQEKTRRDLMETSELLKQKERDMQLKEEALRNKETTIQNLQLDLQTREARVAELEKILRAKDSTVQELKLAMQKALFNFQNNGLSVEVRNGKVYVSMEEKLLFKSGSIVVDPKGQAALLELAKALMNQKDVTVLVEGHTDDVPMNTATIKDNWDLSVLRATSIVRILTTDGKLEPTRVMAAGRGEYIPVENNKTPEARAKNRRTEIILTPKLDELIQILGN
jgi:chemotaxis protein MotB